MLYTIRMFKNDNLSSTSELIYNWAFLRFSPRNVCIPNDALSNEIASALLVNGKKIASVRNMSANHNEQVIKWINISTNYENAIEVLRRISPIAIKHGLTVYDAQNPFEVSHNFTSTKIINESVIKMVNREEEILNDFSKKLSVFMLFRLEKRANFIESISSIGIVLNKVRGKNRQELADEVYNFFKQSVRGDEQLLLDNNMFSIVNKGKYRINFCIEFYWKRAQESIVVIDGKPTTKLNYRMSIYEANIINNHYPKQNHDRMGLFDMVHAYKNPADRYVKSAKITKELAKLPFNVQYDSLSFYGNDICFYLEADLDDCNNTRSYLKITDDFAGPLLKVINDIYPYVFDNYYEKNVLPLCMWKDIKKHIREVFLMIVERQGEWKKYCDDDSDKSRNNAIILLQIFDKWLTTQLKYESAFSNLVMNGP